MSFEISSFSIMTRRNICLETVVRDGAEFDTTKYAPDARRLGWPSWSGLLSSVGAFLTHEIDRGLYRIVIGVETRRKDWGR